MIITESQVSLYFSSTGVDQVEDADQKKLKKEVKKQRRRTKSVVHQMQATISNALIRQVSQCL